MNFTYSRAWLDKQLALEEDLIASNKVRLAHAAEKNEHQHQSKFDNLEMVKRAFGSLVREWRQMDKKDIHTMAVEAAIDEKELLLIETNPEHRATPRTLFQLSRYLKISMEHIAVLSGMVASSNPALAKEVERFATKSHGVARLDEDEREALMQFIRALAEEEEPNNAEKHNPKSN